MDILFFMETKIIKILLANDHALLRSGIRMLLEKHDQEDHEQIRVVAEAGDFKELLEILPRITADILMTDDVMPFGDILEVLPVVREQYPGLKIIINSMQYASAPHIKKAMGFSDGLVGFNSPGEDYIKAVETIYKGGIFFYLK